MRSSSPSQPPDSTKLISSVNLVTKLPTKNQKRQLRNVNFAMTPIPEENAQDMENCLNCNQKTISKFAVPKIEKRYTKLSKPRLTARSLPILNFL